MIYIMYCLGWFNCMTIFHILVIDSGSARLIFREFTQDWVYGNWLNTPSHTLMVWVIVLAIFKVWIYQGQIWWWWIVGLWFVKYLSQLFVPMPQYILIFSRTSLSLNHCHFISHVFECFCFIPEFINPSVAELSVLTGCHWFFVVQCD